jgi:hypothetical protein
MEILFEETGFLSACCLHRIEDGGALTTKILGKVFKQLPFYTEATNWQILQKN